jgi:hypothetical protein
MIFTDGPELAVICWLVIYEEAVRMFPDLGKKK